MQPWTRVLLSMTCCAFALGFSLRVAAQDAQITDAEIRLVPATQPAAAGMPQNANAATGESEAAAELPDSPGVIWARSQQTASSQASSATPPQSSSQVNSNPANSPSQSVSQTNSQEQKLQRPVGTAAAPAPPVSGVTAAQPAGVAIAPAKQHRVRTIVLRVGAILGAGAALGTVIALTEATPPKPPGAH